VSNLRSFIRQTFNSLDYSLNRRDTIEKIVSENRLLKKEVSLRHNVSVSIGRYFSQGRRTPDVAIPIGKVRVDSCSVEWIPKMLEQGIHEEEFSIFRFFQDPTETILDLGANYGYGAASIWASGSKACILSFEPNPWHFPCLQAIKDLKPGKFDFLGIGLGARASTQIFTMPVLEGVGLSSLCTADAVNELAWGIPENLVAHALKYLPDVAEPRIQFTEVAWQTISLDDALKSHSFAVPLKKIVAVKLDVEGFESEVIAGGMATLAGHRPLLLIEGANREKAVVDQLSGLGYCYGDFQNDKVVLTSRQSTRVGGFFLHSSRLAEYRDKGLVIEG